jgi:hypothetical protein
MRLLNGILVAFFALALAAVGGCSDSGPVSPELDAANSYEREDDTHYNNGGEHNGDYDREDHDGGYGESDR